MADDLTPDLPSGTDLERGSTRELEERHSKELEKYRPRATHGHETKFRMIYAVLAGVGLAAVAAAAIFMIGGRPPKPPQWSSWKPSGSGDQALGQIADHIAPSYRLPTGEQLVAVDGGPLQIAGIPVKVLLRPTPKESAPSNGKGALYTLCGLGNHCSIKAGHPSHERTLLMQREAYELALYTFRYVGDVKQVVVLLPPPPGKTPTQAMFFRKDDLKPELARPLRFTLPGRPPSIRALKTGSARKFINRSTAGDVYNFGVIQAQDASLLLELAHFPLQDDSSTSTSP
ncbi:MAG TPA: hypothetical protein VGI67_08985 [Thermoleophilaceae bacterium]|jgi:hypothetical protein